MAKDPSDIEAFTTATEHALQSVSELQELAWARDFDHVKSEGGPTGEEPHCTG